MRISLAAAFAFAILSVCSGRVAVAAGQVSIHDLPTSSVTITAVLCQASQERYLTKRRVIPELYLDRSATPLSSALVTAIFGPDWVTLKTAVNPGFHRLSLIAPYGATALLLDVLPGHQRTVTANLCMGVPQYDPAASVTVILPLAGLSPYLLLHSGTADSFIQMTVEDRVAYATSLGPGAIELVIPYASSEACRFELNATGSAWENVHYRFRLSIHSMSLGARNRQCGRLQPL